MLQEKTISPDFSIRNFRDFPEEIQAIKTKAFSHSILTPKAQELDDAGLKCGLFWKGEFKAGITLGDQETLLEWSRGGILINSEFHYFQRGFIGDNIKVGSGGNYILALMLHVIDSSTYYLSVKKETNGVRFLFEKLNFEFIEEFDSVHQMGEAVRLNLYRYKFNSAKLSLEREAMLNSITLINA